MLKVASLLVLSVSLALTGCSPAKTSCTGCKKVAAAKCACCVDCKCAPTCECCE